MSFSRRTNDGPAEHWQQQQLEREPEPPRVRRRRESNADPLPPVPTGHRHNSSRKLLSRSPVPYLEGSARDEGKQAPKNSNLSHVSASTNITDDEQKGLPIPKKSSSRRRRSTISAASPTSREEAGSTTQIPTKHDIDDATFQKSLLSPVNFNKMRSPIQSEAVRRADRSDQVRLVVRDRVPSPSPTLVFREDIFSGGKPLKHDSKRAPPESNARVPGRNRENASTKDSNRMRGFKEITSRQMHSEASSPRLYNVPHKNPLRQPKPVQQEPSTVESHAISDERTQQSVLRRPESLVSPPGHRYRSFPSPPRQENEVLLNESLLMGKPSSESDRSTSYPSPAPQTKGVESREDRMTRNRSRRPSQSSRYVEGGIDSTANSSSGVTHYATASDHSLDPIVTQNTSQEDVFARRRDTKSQKQESYPSVSRRSSPFDLDQISFAAASRVHNERSHASRHYVSNVSSSTPVEESRVATTNKASQRQASASESRDNSISKTKGGLKSSLRQTQMPLKSSASFAHPNEERIVSRASPLPQTQGSRMFLRSDDSMTYVAITASASPRSDSDQSDELSDASNYTDHQTPEPATKPLHSRKRTSPETSQTIKRRDALLTGLGLSNLNEDSPIILSSSDGHTDNPIQSGDAPLRSSYSRGVESTSGYVILDDLHSTSRADTSPGRQAVTSRYGASGSPRLPSSSSMASPFVQHSTPTPASRNARRSSATQETPRPSTPIEAEKISFSSERNGGSPFIYTDRDGDRVPEEYPSSKDRQLSREGSRRDTWIYNDDDQQVELRSIMAQDAKRHGDGTLLRDKHKESSHLSWSERDSINDTFSEGAQRMLDQLQQSPFPRADPDGIESSSDLKDQHQWSRDHDQEDYPPRHLLDGGDQERNVTVSNSEVLPSESNGPRTWRNTISGSAYRSLLERHGAAEMKRQDIIFELCETEMAFAKSMKLVLHLFSDPLRIQGRWVQGVPLASSKQFEWLEYITDLHSQISSALHSARASQFPLMLHFADIMRPFIHRFEVHLPFLVHLEDVSREIDSSLRDPRSKYGDFVRTQTLRPECENMGLTSFLLKPMQRLTKYPLFFKQIWELTPRSHPDHLSMFSLFNSMDLVIKVIQEVKAREEELTYIKELASRISGLPHTFGLAHRERRLIAQGLIRRVFLSDKDREVLEGYGTPSERSREPSPRPSMPPSPKDPSTPPLPELGKLGPITSPLFPAYHNKTPILPYASSPFTPRRSYMSALSRTSTALSEASHSSEWMASNSATSSVAISSDFDTGERPDSSASSILSIIQSPFSPYSANASMNAQRRPANSSTKNAWSKGTKEIPVYAFVFTDMILFTTQAEKHGLFQHKQVPSESMSLVDVVGISRVLGVCDRSGKLDYDYLIQVDVLPVSYQGSTTSDAITSVYLTLPTTSNSRLNLKPVEQLTEAKEKWMAALDRTYGYTLRSLTFPSLVTGASCNATSNMARSSVMSLLSSGQPLPKSPKQQPSIQTDGDRDHVGQDEHNQLDRRWWSQRFSEVLREIERVQDTPVMLIGDAALTMGRGLKRVHTTDRTKRNGPQQLLLTGGIAMKSPSASSGSSNSRKSLLSLKRR